MFPVTVIPTIAVTRKSDNASLVIRQSDYDKNPDLFITEADREAEANTGKKTPETAGTSKSVETAPFTSMNVSDATVWLSEIDDKDLLATYREIEVRNGNRKGVLRAIDDMIEAL